MGYQDRNNRSGGGRNFGGGRSFDRPTMHKATCDNCGKTCEVPFRPTGSKPVFCRDCFSLAGGSNVRSESQRSDRNDSRRSNREDRPMYNAVCDNCGKNCQLPFEPRSGKPVFCSNCFESNGQAPRRSDSRSGPAGPNYKEQFEALNAKVDKILEILTAAAALDEVESNSMEEEVKEDATSDVTDSEVVTTEEEAEELKKKPKTKATLAAKKKRESKRTPTKKK